MYARCPSDRRLRKGFTLVELLVVLAIIAVLAALLFPVFGFVRNKAKQANCTANLKQLTASVMLYTQDYDEDYPYWNWSYASQTGSKTPNHLESLWFNCTYAYVKNANVYACPNASDNRTLRRTQVWSWTTQQAFNDAGIDLALRDKSISYGMNEPLSNGSACNSDGPCVLAALDQPTQTLLLADSYQGLAQTDVGLPRPGDTTDPRQNFIISRVAYANSPVDCYLKPLECGARQQDPSVLAAKAGVYDQQTRHSLGSVLSFADGHVKWLSARKIVMGLFQGHTE